MRIAFQAKRHEFATKIARQILPSPHGGEPNTSPVCADSRQEQE
jgi:hypothetical protein